MAAAPRPWRRSALVGRALPGLALPGRRRESPAEVWFDCVDESDRAEVRAEAGMVDPNAESRAAPRDGADPFASVKGTGARFPSAVCLLMPEGSNDLTACAAGAVPNRESEKTEGFEPLTGSGDREGLSTSGAPRGTAVGLTCVAVLREGPAVVARPFVRAGYAPETPRASSNENLNSLCRCRCASALAPPSDPAAAASTPPTRRIPAYGPKLDAASLPGDANELVPGLAPDPPVAALAERVSRAWDMRDGPSAPRRVSAPALDGTAVVDEDFRHHRLANLKSAGPREGRRGVSRVARGESAVRRAHRSDPFGRRRVRGALWARGGAEPSRRLTYVVGCQKSPPCPPGFSHV